MVDFNEKLAKLRIKSGKIYSQLYTKRVNQEYSLAELFEKDMISLDSKKATKYMKLTMDVELIENQIHALTSQRHMLN
ncbi:MAG: hypothetical protein Q8M10_00780 [Methylotenera sp.]|uniref:hypothetical protein n=1 Tax=Methylotenera sp. TaxID=2051956 RepID=UPI00272F76FD|nr:hypothetical protein [Methylotenera sp.]MDP1521666.1 hypothetical protein [Methylotenera sp.]